MSMQSPVGTLDIKNATLRVGKLEVSNVQGIDTALNVTRANSVLVYDDQVSTTTFSGFTSTAGVRDTGNGYLNIAGGHVYWGQKLPNSWVMDFEMDIRSGTSAGPLYANVFSTTNTGGDGYSFTFNDNNDKITLKYDGTTLAEATVSGLFTASENWQKVVINYERGLIAISVDGSRKFYYKDIERSTPYVNGEYINFSSASTDGRKIRDLRIVNGEKWVYSGESNVAFTQGSVGVGVTDPAYTLDVGGDINLSGSFYQGGSPFVSSLWTDGANSLYYRSNVEVGTGNLFVDTTTSNVGIRTTTPAYELDVAGNVHADYFLGDGSQLTGIATDLESVSNIGNTTSNTVQFTNPTTGFVTESNVGIANTNPQNNLDIGSNLSVLDTGSNVLSVRGNVNATSITIGDFQIVSSYGLDHVTNENNQTTDTIISTNATTGFQATSNIVAEGTVQANKIVSTSNLEVGTANLFVDTTTSNVGIGTNTPDYELDVVGNVNATYLIGDGSAISAIQSSNVTDFASNVSRIGALETSRALGSDLDNNSARITNLSSNLSDNSSRITALESGDLSISGEKTFTGQVIFESNIHMAGGNVLVANTVNMTVSDPIIELGSGNIGTGDVGIIMTRANNNSNVAFIYDESDDILRMGYTLNGANDTVVSLDSNALAVNVQGALSAANVSGDGSGLTSLNASNITTGALSTTTVTIDDYLIHGGDIDTKVGFPSADTFTVTTANSERLRVDSSGLVVSGGHVKADSVKTPSVVDRNDVVVYEQSGPHDRPLTKYPEVAMTANSSGGYVASASSQYAGGWYDIWKAHDGERTNAGSPSYYYSSSHEIYSTTNGAYAPDSNIQSYSTTSSGTAYPGEYVQMQFPTPIKLSYVRIVSASTSTYNHNAPKQGVICGSNDGTTWTTISTYSGITYHTLGASAYIQASTDVAYTYIRLVVTHTGQPASSSSTSSGWLTMEEIEYYATEEGDVSTDSKLTSVLNKPGTQNLEVYWDGADSNSYSGSGTTVNDLSGNGVTGTINGNGVTFDSTYNAWTFAGSDDYIQASLDWSGDVTHSMSFWLKRDSGTTNFEVPIFVGSISDTDSVLIDSCSSISLRDTYVNWFFAWNDINYSYTTPNLIKDAWHHFVLSYTSGASGPANKKIYMNGIELSVLNDNHTSNTLSFNSSDTYVRIGGGYYSTIEEDFVGSVANFRLYKDKALNAEQVKELYAYDAVRFGHRTGNSVSMHKGNLGVGVTAPTSRFEVAGREDLQEYPPRAMDGFETYMEGHGVFKANWANWYAGNTPTGMYNKQNAVGGQTNIWYGPYDTTSAGGNGTVYNGGSVYSGTDFAASTTNGLFLDDVNGNRYHGAWTTLEMPYDILLQRIHLYQGAGSEGINSRCITEDGVILGSANGHEWHHVHTFTGLQYGGTVGSYSFDAAGESVTVNATTPYKHYALVTTRTLHYAFTVIIGELIWFGTPAPSTLDDGKLTLGKQLTTPRVSGHGVGSETPRAESLIAHFDTTVDSVKSGNTAVDTSGAGSNGTFEGNATYSSSDRAMRFDGTGDKVTASFPSSAGDNTFSVSFWMKRAANSATYCPFFLGDATTGEGIGMDIYTNGSVYWFIYGGKNFLWTGVTGEWFPVGAWTHVAARHTAGTDFVNLNKVWINGIDVSAGKGLNGPNTADLSLDANDTITLGARVGSNYLNGSISNFKIWGGVALTADEVAAEYALGRIGKTLNVTDTAVCLGGTVPRAQLDVRGTGVFDGGLVIKADNLEYARDGGITLSRAGLGTAGNEYSSQPIVLDGGDAGAVDANIRGGAIWSQWGSAQYGIAMKGASMSDTYPYLQTPTMFVTNDKVGINTTTPQATLHANGSNFIPTGKSYFQTGQITKNNGNTGTQTKNYFAVDIGNGYNQFQVELKGYCRNSQGNGNTDPFRRLYTVRRNLNSNASWVHTSAEDIDASGWSFSASRSGGSTSTQTIYFTVVMPNKNDNATYMTIQATVLAQNGGIAHSARIP